MKRIFAALLLLILLPSSGRTQERIKFPVGVSSKVLGYGHLWAAWRLKYFEREGLDAEVVLRDAPLGTYLGWNIVSDGFFKGQICNYAGGMIPFAHTRAERLANGDPRLSLEERYGSHNGYVSKVSAAALNAFFQGYLLKADVGSLISQAAASNVLQP